jgi:carbon monoxide dehydrogenase subunit G
MVQVERTFTVNAPCDVVVSYLRDFAHAESWDPGTVSCRQETPGEPGVGTVWHNVSRILGRQTELSYRLTRDEPRHVTFVGENKTATSTDDLTFEPAGEGSTTITYRATVEFHGLAKLADPVMRIEFNRLAAKLVPQLTRAVEALAAR